MLAGRRLSEQFRSFIDMKVTLLSTRKGMRDFVQPTI